MNPSPSDQAARNRLRDVLAGDRWMVIVAHPDDEAFGCGSLIAHAASSGADVTVVCATRGEAGEATQAIAAGADLGQVRAAELRRAVDVLGGRSVDLLTFLDSGFDGEPAEGSLCAAPIETVTDVLLDRIHAVRPHVVIVLDGSDGHRDHLQIREAVISALGRHRGDVWLFEHSLPNSLMRRWLDEMRALEPGSVYHSIDPEVFGRPDAEVTDVLDLRHLLDTRQTAIAAHRSQKSPFDRLSTELRLAFLATDHLVRVDPHENNSRGERTMADADVHVVEQIYAAMAGMDIDRLFELLDRSIVLTQDARLPWGGRHEGHDGFAQFGMLLRNAISSAVTTDAMFAADDDVVQMGRTKGTVVGSGASFDIAEVHRWTIRDGRAIAAHFSIDTPAMLRVLAAG